MYMKGIWSRFLGPVVNYLLPGLTVTLQLLPVREELLGDNLFLSAHLKPIQTREDWQVGL